ncbi:MAG: helix-turn-helix transcriptional regulator [Lachnospiraceae bacterium]
MIVFDRLWKTMEAKNVTQYKLITTYGMSTSQLTRLRHNRNISSYTINILCEILDCRVEDIMEYKKDSQEIL